MVLKILGDIAIEAGDSLFTLETEPIFARASDLDIGEEQAKESLEILEDDGLASLFKVHDRDGIGILNARLTELGFERYLGSYLGGYDSLARGVGFELLNRGQEQQDADDVARRLEAPVAAVRHIVRRFKERNLIHAVGVNEGNIIVTETRPRLRRWLEAEG